MRYKIGNFEFLDLQGNPDSLKEQIEVTIRPGVDGIAVWKTGVRGKPFTLRSVVDALDVFHARQLFKAYADLVGADPVQLIWADMAAADDNVLIVVLDVRPISIRQIAGGVGGLNPPSCGWCECDWDLILITKE